MLDYLVAGPLSEFREQLEKSLGSAYSIEHELGGGGMSRVFVALEKSLNRRVVVKVLPPDLAAGVNSERFRREIMLVAQLQHPHIVPVHSAGEIEGVPYFTMPFIEGESLRTRLARVGSFSLPVAMRLLRDVIDAIAYAHEHGVLHRDIKPDNILLSGQHAVVTDFGVAKALSAANRRRHSGAVNTGVGVAIGTPAYMAPEQAAGDPALDHRADIYGFGVLAYEVLSGRTPFVDRPPHEMLAAQISERPPHIADLCPDLPPALTSLVMRCLEKRAADRPQTATDLRHDIEALATPGSGTFVTARVPRYVRRRVLPLVATAIVIVALAAGLALRPRARPVDDNVVAVLPFRIMGADPSLLYLREGMLDILAAKLTGEGGPRSADPRALLHAWRRSAHSDTANLPRKEALELAEGLGAGQLLLGDIGGTPDRLVLNASLLRVRDGRVQAQSSVAGPADSLSKLVDELTAKLLALGAGQGERLTALTSTSLPALRAYLDGQTHYRRAHYREAATHFERALQHDSTFALAALGLATVSGWYGSMEAHSRGLDLAWRQRDRLSDRDRALLEATAGPRYPSPPTYSELMAAKRRYVALAPDRLEAWFELGDGLFHYGALLGMSDSHEQAAAAFRRVLASDSAFSPAVEHLLLIDARAGDTASVRWLGSLYLGLDSASENADGVRWRMAVSLGDDRMHEDVMGRVETLTPISAHSIWSIGQLDGVDLESAERAFEAYSASDASKRSALERVLPSHDLAMNLGRPEQALAATDGFRGVVGEAGSELRERIGDALYWDGDTVAASAAARSLERFVSAPPPDPKYRLSYDLNFCFLEQWRLAHGNLRTARQSLEHLGGSDGNGDAAPTRFAANCAIMLDAMLASLERRPDARAQVARLDSMLLTGPQGPIYRAGNLVLARLKESNGDPAGALAAVRRREYFYGRPIYLTTYLREEGRLAALTGDREGAIAAYRHYVALRADPAEELEKDRDQIVAELERLERESVGR